MRELKQPADRRCGKTPTANQRYDPRGEKVFAFAKAEELAPGDTHTLVWVDPTCLVVNTHAFAINPHKGLLRRWLAYFMQMGRSHAAFLTQRLIYGSQNRSLKPGQPLEVGTEQLICQFWDFAKIGAPA